MGLELKTAPNARRVLLVGILSLAMLGGCAYLRWPFTVSTTPAPSPPHLAAAPAPTPVPPPQVAHRKRRYRTRTASRTTPTHQPPASGETKSGVAPETTPTASATPQAAATVTLAGEAPDPASSRALLDEAGQRIKEVDRAKLGHGQAAVYDQVTDLVNAGHDALNRHDYLAALSLAQKASALADQLPSKSNPD